MSSEEFEQRFNNALATIIENQARFEENQVQLNENQARFDRKMQQMQEAIAGLIQVARIQDERLDRTEKQTEENGKQIAALIEQGQETREDLKQMNDAINALIRIVEGHVTNHP